jgi:hypothetical protein
MCLFTDGINGLIDSLVKWLNKTTVFWLKMVVKVKKINNCKISSQYN